MRTTSSTDQSDPESWSSMNQRMLATELAELRHWLERRLENSEDQKDELDEEDRGLEKRPGEIPGALETLARVFGLTRFERTLLLLCAAPDLDSTFGPLLARVQAETRRAGPTFSLALATLPEPHWSALSPAAPLRRWRFIEPASGDTLTTATLRLDEWALHYLAGVPHLDERLTPIIRPLPESGPLSGAQATLAGRIVRLCRERSAFEQGAPAIQVCSSDPDGAYPIFGEVARVLQERTFRLNVSDLPANSSEREMMSRLWEREAAASGAILAIDLHEGDTVEARRTAAAFVESTHALVWIVCREPLRITNRPAYKFELPRATATEQRDLWRRALGPVAGSLNGTLDSIAGQFQLEPRQMHAVAQSLASRNADKDSPADPGALWTLCRLQTRARLEALAQRIEAAAVWDDLVLPEAQTSMLREIAAHVRQRFRVCEEWGFGKKGDRGLGASALFAGASGTGKTMAAEVLANELQLDLFRIDLSAVVSKYIGETEKNLRAVFDAAERGGAILLFDEADALFGKRSEVKDSHDRYANIEVSYLLQRMEGYRGLAILTTNFKQALDPAFLRRLRYVVNFPFPDAAQRAEIWRRIFPAATPTDSLNAEKLARLNLAGGHIRCIAINAAFLAADAGQPVRMQHLLHAAQTECAKLERPLNDAEVGGWV